MGGGSIISLNAAGIIFSDFLRCCLVLKGPHRSLALGRNSLSVTPHVVLGEIMKTERDPLLNMKTKHFFNDNLY